MCSEVPFETQLVQVLRQTLLLLGGMVEECIAFMTLGVASGVSLWRSASPVATFAVAVSASAGSLAGSKNAGKPPCTRRLCFDVEVGRGAVNNWVMVA